MCNNAIETKKVQGRDVHKSLCSSPSQVFKSLSQVQVKSQVFWWWDLTSLKSFLQQVPSQVIKLECKKCEPRSTSLLTKIGAPLVVLHGTGGTWEAFDLSIIVMIIIWAYLALFILPFWQASIQSPTINLHFTWYLLNLRHISVRSRIFTWDLKNCLIYAIGTQLKSLKTTGQLH